MMSDNSKPWRVPSMETSDRKFSGSLTQQVVAHISSLIDSGSLAPGEKLPSESEIVRREGVSRTVVREAISKLQASGLVATRHGVGTFVIGLGDGSAFRIAPEQLATLRDVVAMLELRI